MESNSSTERERSPDDQQRSRTESQSSVDSMKESIFFQELMSSDSDEESSLTHEEKRSDSKETSNWKTEEQKCYDPLDATFTFIDGDDDLDFLCEDFKGLRAKMSCGHAVTPMSLTKWCRRLLDEGKCRFECGACDVKWPFEEVQKMALLTPKEINYFEKKMFSNTARDLDFKVCPGCQSRVMRTDLHDLSVKCPVCTADKGRTYIFCWQCLREWKVRFHVQTSVKMMAVPPC